MWAHYGNSSAGMCIGYAVSVRGNPRLFQPVTYSDDFTGPRSLHDLMTMKSKDWSYEKEWRAIMGGDEQRHYGLAHPVTVVLGPRCTHDSYERINSVLPKTVKEFSIAYPVFKNGKPDFHHFEVSSLIEQYGRIPDFADVMEQGHRGMDT